VRFATNLCVILVVFLSHTLATQQEQLLVAFERSQNRSKTGLLFREEEEEEKFSFLFVEAFL
jgi:hypothetical protein